MPKAKMLDMTTNVDINAENLFTDREEPRKAFWDIYESMEDGDYEVIAYYGVGGIGKTTLLRQIGKEMDEKIFGGEKDHLFISFEGKPEKEEVLYLISRQLMICNKGLSCPLFDEAFCRILELLHKSSEPYEKEMRKLISDNPVFSTIVELANDLSPIPGVIGATASVVDSIVSLTRSRLKEKDMLQGPNAYLYNEIKSSDQKDIIKNIHKYLRQDIQEYMAKRERPFVFLIDGYENFVDIRETGKEVMHLEKDEWLKNSDTGFSPIPNTIWVIAGREMPHWDKEVLPSDHMHRIGDLSQKDATDFLKKAGITDSELRERLYTLTNGTPVYMDMCVRTYRKISKEKTPVISDFGKDTAELASRFLENMSKNMKQMIYILTGLPNVFSEELAKTVAYKIEKRGCIEALDEILIMSLTEKVDQGYRLHSTLKDVICKEHRNDAGLDEQSIVTESAAAAMQIIAERIISSNEQDYRITGLKNYTELLGSVRYDGIEDDIGEIIGIIDDETKAAGNYILCEELIKPCVEYLNKNSTNAELRVTAQNIRNGSLYELGKYKEYHECAKETYDYAAAYLGEGHHKTLDSLNYLASSYVDAGDIQAALALMNKCYDLYVEILGEDHLDTIGCLNNLSLIYANSGDAQTALELREKCYGLYIRTLGKYDPNTIRSLSNLAISYGDTGDVQTALELKKECYNLCIEVLGEDHPDTLRCLNNLAVSYEDVGDAEMALELKEKCYALRVELLGEDHPDTLASLNNLTISYANAGDMQTAIILTQQCYELYVQLLGEDHPDTLCSLNNLAIWYANDGDFETALELAETCYVLRVNVLGETHPDTLGTAQLIELIEEALEEEFE